MYIRKVYIFTNGNVMAFDENGKQVPEGQGFIFDVAKSLVKYCDEKTQFYFGQWRETAIPCDFSWWFKKAKTQEEDCPVCHGQGATTDHHDPCTECGGTGKVGGRRHPPE